MTVRYPRTLLLNALPGLVVGALLLGSTPLRAETPGAVIPGFRLEAPQPVLSLNAKGEDPMFEDENQDYRYDFGERHLTFGLNLQGNLTSGVTLNGMPYGGGVSPYFRISFGDGNALQLDLNAAINPLSAANAQWVFFRTPILAGSLASGYMAMIAPTISFRYDIELGASISKRSPVVYFVSFGLAPMITYGQADLIQNGSVNGTGETHLTNMEVMADIVPTTGLKLRLGEFGGLELGAKMHFLWPIAANINNGGWFFSRPFTVPELWIENSRVTEFYLGFSYDFG